MGAHGGTRSAPPPPPSPLPPPHSPTTPPPASPQRAHVASAGGHGGRGGGLHRSGNETREGEEERERGMGGGATLGGGASRRPGARAMDRRWQAGNDALALCPIHHRARRCAPVAILGGTGARGCDALCHRPVRHSPQDCEGGEQRRGEGGRQEGRGEGKKAGGEEPGRRGASTQGGGGGLPRWSPRRTAGPQRVWHRGGARREEGGMGEAWQRGGGGPQGAEVGSCRGVRRRRGEALEGGVCGAVGTLTPPLAASWRPSSQRVSGRRVNTTPSPSKPSLGRVVLVTNLSDPVEVAAVRARDI